MGLVLTCFGSLWVKMDVLAWFGLFCLAMDQFGLFLVILRVIMAGFCVILGLSLNCFGPFWASFGSLRLVFAHFG